MSRRIPALALMLVGLLLTAAACSSNATGPSPIRADQTCTNWASNGTCLH
jgi:ABC-type glycerol-3-phosphate transport system substrate-binding protein